MQSEDWGSNGENKNVFLLLERRSVIKKHILIINYRLNKFYK